ncbi:glutamine--fructose-6-phosphate transaminase (isomerizing) [bacterium]|nr:glutamine--fructose-6-phosphate transaminase (isomerizing) [bacterium]
MCGIVGYVGDRNMESVLLVGLERLSYRGYDSSGIAILSKGELSYWKTPGKLRELEKTLQNMSIRGSVGIGHTRWSTHGEPNEVNAHPHVNTQRKIAIVHNGIIENYLSLKNKLLAEGFLFRSQTDSEVIVHLIARYLQGNLVDAVQRAVLDLEGTYAFAVIAEDEPDTLVACRKGSPLIIGLGKDEQFVSSDVNAIIPHTKEMVYLDDMELAIVKKEGVTVKKMGGGVVVKPVHVVTWDASSVEKNGYDHYMLKEIHEQSGMVRSIYSQWVKGDKVSFDGLQLSNEDLVKVTRFIIQACGTSWHAGLVAKYWIEQHARILTEVDISSEFRYRHMITGVHDIVVAISQSGETADTLACIREAKSKFFKVLSFVNVAGSTIDRESDGVIHTLAGPEIGVASTKNFVAQLVTLYLFTLYVGQLRWSIDADTLWQMTHELKTIPDHIDHILSQSAHIQAIAKRYAHHREFLFIGRGVNYPTALEGALKLKEISYIHATGYAAGELKHGPIALIDDQLPVVCIAPRTGTYDKMMSNIQEVRARKGKTIVIASEGDTDIEAYADDIIRIPVVSDELTPILTVIPLQLLSYYMAVELGCDVDQPRNLAKSVTVE